MVNLVKASDMAQEMQELRRENVRLSEELRLARSDINRLRSVNSSLRTDIAFGHVREVRDRQRPPLVNGHIRKSDLWFLGAVVLIVVVLFIGVVTGKIDGLHKEGTSAALHAEGAGG